jgi:cell wall assembly regulator SMI1
MQTPVTEQDISRIESILERSLPEDFKAWLRRYNGAIPNPSELLLPDGSIFDINSFISFSENDTKENVLLLLDIYRDRLPAGLLPIADDGTGNYVCFRYGAGKTSPDIVLWFHEEADPSCAIMPIASSFTDLIQRIQNSDSGEAE